MNGFLQGGVLKLDSKTNSEDVVEDENRQKRMFEHLSKSVMQNGSQNLEESNRNKTRSVNQLKAKNEIKE